MMVEATETWESRVATEWAAQLWCRPENAGREMDVEFATSIAQAMKPYLAPFGLLERLDHPRLQDTIAMLKRQDGEQWAVGEALERMCILLDFHKPVLKVTEVTTEKGEE